MRHVEAMFPNVVPGLSGHPSGRGPAHRAPHTALRNAGRQSHHMRRHRYASSGDETVISEVEEAAVNEVVCPERIYDANTGKFGEVIGNGVVQSQLSHVPTISSPPWL